jgi:DDE domain
VAEHPDSPVRFPLEVLWQSVGAVALGSARHFPEHRLATGDLQLPHLDVNALAVCGYPRKLTPALAVGLRRRRRGKAGRSWYADETYIKVHGRWCYLYRAIDRSGALPM